MMSSERRSLLALDGLNLFLADVRDGLGPYLAIYLLTTAHWNEAQIGVVMTIAGVATVLAQTPAGAVVDTLRAKRALIMVMAGVVAAACVGMTFASSFAAIAVGQAVIGTAAAFFPPAIAALTLGLVGRAPPLQAR